MIRKKIYLGEKKYTHCAEKILHVLPKGRHTICSGKYTYCKSAQTQTHTIQSINNLMRLQIRKKTWQHPFSSLQPNPTGTAEQCTWAKQLTTAASKGHWNAQIFTEDIASGPDTCTQLILASVWKKTTCSTCNQPLSYTSARTCSRDHAFGGGGESRPTCTNTSKDGDGEMKRKAAAKYCCKSWRWHPRNAASSQNGSRFNCSYVIKNWRGS